MTYPESPIDVRTELVTLRGPTPPVEGQVKGGVVGALVARTKLQDRVLLALALAVLTGIGGAFAWVYAAGQEKGKEKAEFQQMRRDLDEALCRARGGTWRGRQGCDTPDP